MPRDIIEGTLTHKPTPLEVDLVIVELCTSRVKQHGSTIWFRDQSGRRVTPKLCCSSRPRLPRARTAPSPREISRPCDDGVLPKRSMRDTAHSLATVRAVNLNNRTSCRSSDQTKCAYVHVAASNSILCRSTRSRSKISDASIAL
jgi:hypothetical protein